MYNIFFTDKLKIFLITGNDVFMTDIENQKAILLGIIQGISEFLPISSSGHLVLFQSIFGHFHDLTFEILVHLATLFSIFTVMRKTLFQLFRLFILDLKDRKYGLGTDIAFKIFLGCLPAGCIGILFKDILTSFFTSLIIVSYGFLLTAFLLLATHFSKSSKTIFSLQSNPDDEKKVLSAFYQISYLQALLIGCFQALAIVPGVSRSGSTIAGGIFLRLDTMTSTYFSFLLAIPVIIGATTLQFALETPTLNWTTLFTGFLSAYIIGILSLYLLLKIAYKGQLKYFAIYLFFLSFLTLFLQL